MISVDAAASAPPYEQIRRQLAEVIDGGALRPGDRLPTVRALADELGVAANTVARAYRELEQSGLVQTRGRGGTFVAGDGIERAGREAALAYLERTGALGLSPEEALALVRELVAHPVRSS